MASNRPYIAFILILILHLIQSAHATSITGKVKWNSVLPEGTSLRPDTTVTLSPGDRRTYLRKDGSFVLHDVQPGSYVLQVLSTSYFFEPLIINLTPTSIHLQPHNPTRLPHAVTPTLPSLPYPVELVPVQKYNYFDEEPGLDVGGMLKSPMVLMMVFTAVMAFGLPKMMAAMEMDPEGAKEMQEMREKAASFQNTDWSEKLASVLAGSSASTSTSTSAQAVAPATAPSAVVAGGSGSGSTKNVNRRKKR